MEKKAVIEKPLIDQILDDLFTKIEKQKEFDATVIENLRALAGTSGLTKPQRITEAIKIMPGNKS